ncbi:MAG: flagellin [Oscillospiraceae bacterium]
MIVQHNMNALSAYNKLNTNVAGLKKSSEKLSSGYRINRAGDDAAGLAISEKMRSQIRGLNQAKRNSQDGISMIQTYEGALQESHSILQRMKELAAESANGTYQTEVDRDAIQLEFNQLNDELDQIADTDFNGTVMLNGGQMADGTKAVNGKFDYVNSVRDPKQLSSSDVTVTDYQQFDDTAADPANGRTNADEVWKELNANWDRADAVKTNDGPESIDITFKYDATGGADGATFWTATSATGGADVSKITPIAATPTGNTNNGGFKIATAGGLDIANVVVDTSKLVNGDTVTVTLKNPIAAISAPTNAGAAVVTSDFEEGVKADAIKENDANLAVVVGTDGTDGPTDTEMTEAMNAVYKALDGATFTANYTADTEMAATDLSIKFNDDDKTTLTGADDNFGKLTLTVDGKKVEFGYTFTGADGKLVIGTLNADGDAIDTTLATMALDKPGVDTSDSSGSISYKINIENNAYDTLKSPTVEVKNPTDMSVSKANSNDAATAPLTYTDHLVLQAGARTKDSVDFTFSYKTEGMGDLEANLDVSSRANGLGTKNLSLNTQEAANAAIDKIDNAINKVSMVRATFGATQNRLEHKVENLTTTAENLTEAEAGIRDTDMASEMLNYTKFNVLQQAAQSMLAQANQQPQSILQLLG